MSWWNAPKGVVSGGIKTIRNFFDGLTKTLIQSIVKKPRKVTIENKDRLIVSFYGAASSGKSSAAKALYGMATERGPIADITKKVSVWNLPDGLSVADTPGLQSTNEELVKKAKRFIDDVDIFVYIINSNGGITKEVMSDLKLLKAVGRPLAVVLNKIDTILPEEREAFLIHQFSIADVPPDTFFSVAFDPHPQISNEKINIENVRNWINSTIKEKGNKLLEEKQKAIINSN
jgi:GTP-binding protein EngB required for normal cell division